MNITEQASLLQRLADYEQTEPPMDVTSVPQPSRPQVDGYTRRTPIQPLRVSGDYKRGIRRKILGWILGLGFAALVVVAIFRSGMINI